MIDKTYLWDKLKNGFSIIITSGLYSDEAEMMAKEFLGIMIEAEEDYEKDHR